MEDLFTVLLPVLAGGLSTTLMTLLKKGVTLLGTLPALAQQVIVSTFAWALIKVSVLATVTLTTFDVTQLGDQDVLALSAAGLAFVFHLGKKVVGGEEANA